MKVDKLTPVVASRFNPENIKTHAGTPYTGIDFKVNCKKANLNNGDYRLELWMAGAKVAETKEPNIDFTPVFKQDDGKKLELRTYFKSTFSKDYVKLPDDTTWTIQPPPLKVGASDDVNVGDALDIKVALGVASPYMEIGADHVDIESGGYFEASAKKLMQGKTGTNFNFEAKMTSKGMNLRSKTGQVVNYTVTDPITHQSQSFQLNIMPKQQSNGRGGVPSSGGIH